MNFCSHCAHPVEWRLPPGDHLPRFVCPQCQTIHYQNPRIIVGCLCVWQAQILLCRRNIEPQFGYWNLPGGFMENGEDVATGAVREAVEEAGLDIEVARLLTVFSVPRINQVHLHFLAYMRSAQFELTPESSEIRLFSPQEIPWSEIAFQSNLFTLRAYLSELETGLKKVHLGSYNFETY
jgi:ADP-ribose pyrophosphatase YjhB (NUDIX family)